MAFADTVKFTAGSSGTSDFSDGTAVTGFRPLSTGAVSGQDYSYRAFSADLSQWENGHGVYTSGSPGTLARTTIYESSTGSKVSFSSAPVVILTPLAADLNADQARQNFLLNLANMSKVLASSLRVLETFADGYKASDGINSGSSSNYTLNTTSGYVGPSTTGGLIAFGTGTAITDGFTTNSGAAFDGTTSQAASAAQNTGANAASSTYYLGKNYSGVGGKKITKATVYPSSDSGFSFNATSGFSFSLYGKSTSPSSPTDGTLLGTSTLSADQTTSLDITSSDTTTTYNYVWVAMTTTGNTSTKYFAEIQFYEPVVYSNMTLVSTTQTADTTVSNGRVLMEIDPIDSITLNTDLTVDVTADNGSHWTSATLSSIGKGQAGRTIVETADTSFGANTGTSFAVRIKTLNNKNVNVYKTAIAVH
jgi:hypothetical protein